ncbi:unnamed protein product [Tuber aestivum]|uniref:Uncharacterized protein n=1 Tax=Tuber aestivum TaxID=59557 RepID=A0A292PWC5_9PEZI|nr:unnamed protein product [Tuber aestivum]
MFYPPRSTRPGHLHTTVVPLRSKDPFKRKKEEIKPSRKRNQPIALRPGTPSAHPLTQGWSSDSVLPGPEDRRYGTVIVPYSRTDRHVPRYSPYHSTTTAAGGEFSRMFRRVSFRLIGNGRNGYCNSGGKGIR